MKGYEVKKPTKLVLLAVQRLAYYIALLAQEYIIPFNELSSRDASQTKGSLSIEKIRRSLLRNVPSQFHNYLLYETQQAVKKRYYKLLKQGDPRQQDMFGRMVETVFNSNITRMTIHANDLCIPSLCSKSYMLPNLRSLRIYAGKELFEFAPHFYAEVEFNKMLRGLPNLTLLFLKYCSMNVVRCIVKNCKLLEILNLTGPSSSLNDRMAIILTGLSNLAIVDLEHSQVTSKGVEALLMSCENMISIKNTPFLANALRDIASKPGNTEKRFNIEAFKNHSGTTQKELELVVRMCPLIEKLHLEAYPPDEDIQGGTRFSYLKNLLKGSNVSHTKFDFKVINDLKNLCELILKKFNFYSDNIKNILQAKGHNLVELFLDAYDIDLHALKTIVRTCPNLVTMSLNLLVRPEDSAPTFSRSLLKDTKDFFTDLMFNDKEMPPPLKKLKRLSLNVNTYEPMDDQFVILMLTICPNIETINLGYHIWLTQDMVSHILNDNPMVRLKVFKMYGSSISDAQVNCLLKNCAKPPSITIKARFPIRHCIPLIVRNIPEERRNKKIGASISIQPQNFTNILPMLQYAVTSPD